MKENYRGGFQHADEPAAGLNFLQLLSMKPQI